MTSNFCTRVLLATLLLSSIGCIGTQQPSDAFLNQPTPGMDEIEMIQTYGMPDYTHHNGDTTVFVYNMDDRAYYVLFGYNHDVDMVVVCENGKVTDVKNVKAGEGLAILQPNTWNVNR